MINALYPEYSEKYLMEESALIIYGRLIGRSEPFAVENGVRLIFTDYYMEVYEVLRGKTDSNEITVRIMVFIWRW